MKRLLRYFPLWKDLLFLSFIIISYLTIAHFGDARFFSKKVVYNNKDMIQTMWPPSSGEVEHYKLEIRDTRFFPGSTERNAITMVKQVNSPQPNYLLRCEHNHSYKVRTKAVSPSGLFSPFSEDSILLICDQKNPQIELDRLPSPAKLRYPTTLITGSFDEPNLASITINGMSANINLINKSFSSRINLNVGKNHLTLLAQDLAGNTTTKNMQLDYSPVNIVSLPSDAKIYWNGNYAYLGIYSGTTPQSFNQAIEGKQILRLTYPGFNDYYGIIDFSDLTQDTYTLALTPFSGIDLNQGTPIKQNQEEINIDSCSHPFVVDYNLDGKKDLLLGTKEGKIALFNNTGKDSAPILSDHHFIKAEGNDIDVGTHAAPFIVDYNSDAIQDLLVGNGEGLILYYANQGSTSKPVFTSPTALKDADGLDIAVDSYCTPCVVDWNEDHKKDLLLGSGNGTLLVCLNQGSDSDPLFASPRPVKVGEEELDVGSFASPFVADWNGDGKKDLLVGDGEGYIHLYLNINSTGEPNLISSGKVKLSDQDLTVEGSAAPFLVDWNQDGKKDLLVGSLKGYIYLFSN
ncbi:MAG: VCBS repeat-containing protein [Deltaproteobacteria bacterium]|nr:VCBS repeat-containing protein [Deltaproteobacteria bacterium]